MEYEVDEDYSFERDESGFPYLPKGLKKVNGLYILPNGKYLPCGCYELEDGSSLLYHPSQLSFSGKMLRNNLRRK